MTASIDAPAVVITGASSGIGREIARLAAKDGRVLILVGRTEAELQKLVHEFQFLGIESFALSLDLQDADAISRIEATLSARGLYCDILVNSAGFGIFGAVADTDSKLQLQLIDVNVRALVALTVRFLPGMIARGRGGVINVGSITGYAPGPYMASYCASKAFVRSFSWALSAELAGTGVTVTCLTTGIVRTAFFERETMRRTRLTKILPRNDAATVAKVGWKAFKAGRPIAIPRFLDRYIIHLCWLLPDRALATLVSALQRAD
jgi:short-subunit dehydrogenase